MGRIGERAPQELARLAAASGVVAAPTALVAAWLFAEFGRVPVTVRADGADVTVTGCSDDMAATTTLLTRLLDEQRFDGWVISRSAA